MRSNANVDSDSVLAVYNGIEGDLWELIMGEQIHIGGLESSMDLAARAGIGASMRGVDLCSGNGAGMRALVRLMGVDHMTGVEFAERNYERGIQRCADEGLADQIDLVLADACDTGLPSASMDFAWGEDGWCYVPDKAKLVAEAVRLVKPGGVIAFTDWVEGDAGLSEEAADRILTFMKFPTLQTIQGYRELLEKNGCEVAAAEDSGRFTPCLEAIDTISSTQFAYDVLKVVGFNMELVEIIQAEMAFILERGREKGIIQGIFVGRKR